MFISDALAERRDDKEFYKDIKMLPISADEIAKGDYSPEYGTVESVKLTDNTVDIKFINGKELSLDKDDDLVVEQGGRF